MSIRIRDDPFLITPDKTIMENTVRWGGKGFFLGGTLSLVKLNHNFTSRPLLTSLGTMLGGYALPYGATLAVFASTTALMDDWRGKNKAPSNAAIGGFMGGIIYGAKYKCPMKCVNMGLKLAAFAFFLRLGLTADLDIVEKSEVSKLRDAIYISKYSDLRN